MQDTGSLGLMHWDDPEGWYREGGGGGGSEWGTRVHPWWMHVDVSQNQYNIVKYKINKLIKKKRKCSNPQHKHIHKQDSAHIFTVFPFKLKHSYLPMG